MGYWYTSKYLWVLQRTARFVRGVVANSEAVKRITVEKERIPSSKVSVIYNGYPAVEDDALPLDRDQRPAVLRGYELPESGRFAVLVANLREIKRIGDAIQAIAKLSESLPECHLVLIGGGDEKPYRALAESLGVSENVHFLGVRSDVRRVLTVMDVGLLCSESEGYSNAVVEYMQARLPVIASDVGGNSEAIDHSVTGFLYPMGDTAQLAIYLGKILGEKGGAAIKMGEAGYERAKYRHGLQTMIECHTSLYKRVLSGHSSELSLEDR